MKFRVRALFQVACTLLRKPPPIVLKAGSLKALTPYKLLGLNL